MQCWLSLARSMGVLLVVVLAISSIPVVLAGSTGASSRQDNAAGRHAPLVAPTPTLPPISTVVPEERPVPQATPKPTSVLTSEEDGIPPLPPLPPPPPGDEPADDGNATPVPPPPRPRACHAERKADPPRFMSLPFPADPQMEVFHGWRYTHNNQPQCGIDFGKRDAAGRLQSFPVLAVADGEACADRDDTSGRCVRGFGDRVLIRHTIDGETYYTYYGHLTQIDPAIPIGNRGETVRVRRGQVVGYASDTGTYGGSIHLHFGIAAPNFGWYDPYDLWGKAVLYPDPAGLNGLLSGSDYFWTTNPPSAAPRLDMVGGPQASVPADAIAAGNMDVSAWTDIAGRTSGVVEIWINGEKRGEAEFGPRIDGDTSTFEWQWDTSQERNGPHRVRLIAYAEDSRETPLLTTTEAQEANFLITIQNPRGFVEHPALEDTVTGQVPIRGWALAEESEISTIEIWIDGEKRGEAAHSLPHEGAGGNYGFAWEWDTTRERDGPHTLVVRAVAANGGYKELPPAEDAQAAGLRVSVRNSEYIPRWTIR